LLLLLAVVGGVFGASKRAARPTERSGQSKVGAVPPKRDIFLRDRPMLMLLAWGGIPFTLTFLFLSL
jgi:hypothetical protein